MRYALFAAGLVTAASAAKVQDKRQISIPVEDSTVTLSDGSVVTSDPPLGTFTDIETVTSTGVIVVPTEETPSVSVSVSPSVSVSVSVSTSTDTVTSPSSSSTGTADTTVTTTATVETTTATETTGGTETGTGTGTESGTGGEATSTDGEDAAPMATPFAGALGAMAAVGIAMAL